MRAMRNYAGRRLAPWLGHIMVSRQEPPRPLLTPGQVLQLPPGDQLVLMSGCPPLRAKKARYVKERRFTEVHGARAAASQLGRWGAFAGSKLSFVYA
jgi:type IV secretion system protein VirD4